jgi:DNA replication initiation complex subunit (GINS family)
MKLNKYIISFVLLGIFFLGGINGVKAEVDAVSGAAPIAENAFYASTKCWYERSNGKQAVIERKYTANGIVNTVTRYKKDGSLDDTKDRTIAFTGFWYVYNNTTECPKSVDIKGGGLFSADQIYPFDYETEYVLYKQEATGENLLNKLPTCEYQSNVSQYKGEEFKLIHTPVFEDYKTHYSEIYVKILTFKVSVQKTILQDGDFVWIDETSTPLLGDKNQYTTTCPTYAHYNPPGSIHEYVLTSSFDKPKGWKEDYILERYVDFSSQEAAMDKIHDDFKKIDDDIYYDLSDCFDSLTINASTCDTVNLKSGCLTLDKLKSLDQKLVSAYNDAMAKIRAIKLDGDYTVKDIEEGNISSSIYKGISQKYATIIESIKKKFSLSSEMISCAYLKLENDTTLTEEEKEEITTARAESEEERSVIIKELSRIDGNFNVDPGEYDCSVILDDAMIEWIEAAFLFIQIGAAVVVAVMGMLDFSRAAVSNDADAMKKAWQKFIKRLLALLILLLLPFIIQFLLGLIEIPGLTNTDPLCK